MNNITTSVGGGAVGAAGRFKAIGRYLAAFKAAEPWRETYATVDRSRFATQRNTHGELIALSSVWKTDKQKALAIKDALAIRAAILPHKDAIEDARYALGEAMKPAPEHIVMAIISTMLMVLKSKPNEGSAVFVGALVSELMEPETGEPFCVPAIAAAAKQIWTTKTFAPSIPEFMEPVREHQRRIEEVECELDFMMASLRAAREVLQVLAPEKLPPRKAREPTAATDDDSIPF
jgi:hypothetical protein